MHNCHIVLFCWQKAPQRGLHYCLTVSSKMCFFRVSRMQTRKHHVNVYHLRHAYNCQKRSSDGQQPSEQRCQGLRQTKKMRLKMGISFADGNRTTLTHSGWKLLAAGLELALQSGSDCMRRSCQWIILCHQGHPLQGTTPTSN